MPLQQSDSQPNPKTPRMNWGLGTKSSEPRPRHQRGLPQSCLGLLQPRRGSLGECPKPSRFLMVFGALASDGLWGLLGLSISFWPSLRAQGVAQVRKGSTFFRSGYGRFWTNMGGVCGERSKEESQKGIPHLTWKCTDPCRKTTFLLVSWPFCSTNPC